MASAVDLFAGRTAPDGRSGSRVVLVGAGPGDPGLLTRKADAAIRAADIVFYDDLVSSEIMAEIPSTTTRVYVGKRHGAASTEQADIIDAMVVAARNGKRVVRLKGGDPMIFGRGGEEIEGLHAAGIEVVVVPGVTAALGAAGSAGIPLTHRDHAAQVTIVTGTRRDGSLTDVQGLAGEGKTLVIYMAVKRAGDIVAALRADNVAGDLPVAVVERATRPDERIFIATVDTLVETVAREAVETPALLIVGRVAAARSEVARHVAAAANKIES